jgi:serine/threonine protein kinase
MRTIKVKRYTEEEKLGEGSYGVVYKGIDNQTMKTVAIKKIKIFQDQEGIASSTLREISILKSLHHPNIVE